MPPSNGQPNLFTLFSGKTILNSLPAFHAAGLLYAMAFGAYFENTAYIWGPPDRPMSSVLVPEMLDIAPIDSVFLPPCTLEELIESPISFQKIKKIKICAFAGGPLSKQAGDKLAPFTTILSALGSIQVACKPIYAKSSLQDWEYFHYLPCLRGIEFRPIHSPPTPTTPYEQVIVRHPSTDIYHGTRFTFPEKTEYGVICTCDILIPRNRISGYTLEDWMMFLFFQTAKNPTRVLRKGHLAPALIVELTANAATSLERREGSEKKVESTRLLESIWLSVAEANASVSQHAQIAKDMVFFTSSNKPFPRTPKGTVVRRQGTELYAKEIEEFYARSEHGSVYDTVQINLYDKRNVVLSKTQGLVQKVMGDVELEPDVDFFVQGMDSLHVVRIAKQLRACVIPVPEGTSITTSDIYSNPSIIQLTRALKHLSVADGPPTNEFDRLSNGKQHSGRGAHYKYREIPMHETLRKYINSHPTGSTGSLGSYLLSNLVFYPEIRKIYCLNRRPDARAGQDEVNRERGITSNFDPSVVEFLHVDLSKPLLGLEENVYNKLLNEVGVIIHNAYPVSFTLTLGSFKPHIQGTLNSINFYASSNLPHSQKPWLSFTSSIGTLGNWSSCHPIHSGTPVPEAALHDSRIPLEQGYSESKWICERLIQETGAKSGVRGTVLRIGQIAGPALCPGPEGMWNKKEWLPSKDQACSNNESVKKNSNTEYFHLQTPNLANWEDLIPAIQSYYISSYPSANPCRCKPKKKLEIVSWTEWIKRLEQSSTEDALAADLEKNPALHSWVSLRGWGRLRVRIWIRSGRGRGVRR
ncbi:male sterility protein-domain-containing protein [Halenospora varia]|nr:male sterility protein-domain-containing protein [Halenospora varia]